MSSTSDHHVDDTPSTSDPLVKGHKGKVLYPCLICKAMHRTFLCPLVNHDGENGKGIILKINGSSLSLPLNMALVCISFQSIGYSADLRDDPLS